MSAALRAVLMLAVAGTAFAQEAEEAPVAEEQPAEPAPELVAEPAPEIPPPDTIAVQPLEPQAAPPAPEEASTRLDDMVVTANKRAESARNLAGAVTAVGRERLDETGASNFGEYLSLSPGVNYNAGPPGYSVITIRGVSSDTVPGLAQTAVGVYYDDIPLTDPAAPMVVPDIDAYDADRIEMLRGPQGALYGSASLGGAVNYIPEAPDLFNFDMSARVGGSQTVNASAGGNARLMLNTPLFAESTNNALGLRVVGHYTDTPGYIDNVGGANCPQCNASRNGGGRAILGWAPSLNSMVRLTGLYQRTDVEDAAYVDESLGDLRKSTLTPEPSNADIVLSALRYENEQDYGSWALIGGWQKKGSRFFYDGATALGTGGLGEEFPLFQEGTVEGYSAEARFVSSPGETFDWFAGASYADRTEEFFVSLNSSSVATAAAIGSLLTGLPITPADLGGATTLFDQQATIKAPEAALFADATYRFTDTIKLTAGGRYYQNEVNSFIDGRGVVLLPGGSTTFQEYRSTEAKGFNPKVSLAWQATEDWLLYGLYSRGYRLGGPNLVPSTPVTVTKRNYGPDEVQNYEVGTKAAWLDGLLTLELTGFWIDWHDIILSLQESTGLFKYLDNAGEARIQGVETGLAFRPLDFLTARTSLTWMDARLLQDFDPNNMRPPARAGDPLPGSPEWTTSTSLTGVFFLGSLQPTVTLLHRWESESSTNLSFQDVKKGDAHLFDARAGVKLGAFTITAFGKNLTDERAVTASNNYAQASGDVLTLKFIQPPRTFGLELGYSFQAP